MIDEIVTLLIIGVTFGAIYATMTLGLSFICGVTRMFNYAHGAFYIWAAYIAWVLLTYINLNYAAVAIIIVPVMFLFGLAFEKALMYPLRRSHSPNWEINVIIVTLGAGLLLGHLAFALFGVRPQRLPLLVEGSFSLYGFLITWHDAVTVVAALTITGLLTLFLWKARLGMAMRAIAQDITGARIVGIPIDRMFGYSFAIAGALAGISAIFLAPKMLIHPEVGWLIFVRSFVIMVFGGLGSLKGTVVAAFIMATIEAFVTFYLGGVWAIPTFISVLVVVLVIRPRGLFGRW
jgi:branched-chain amino acid transport system permease protein